MNSHESIEFKNSASPDDASILNGAGPVPRRPDWPSAFSLLLILAAIAVGFGGGLLAGSARQDFVIDSPAMTQCMANTTSLLDFKKSPNSALLSEVMAHCYSLLRSQGLLRDFAIRELNFVQQYRANGVMMWMVVAITIFGVILAGMQVIISYLLASSNDVSPNVHSEITLSRDRVILKSSITGLFILLISFAFFLVFVLYIYRFDRPEIDGARAGSEASAHPMGQLDVSRSPMGK